MGGNSFGKLFRITTFGESHGEAIGVVIDGCPAGMNIDLDFIQAELDRRKPGQNKISSQRKEPDTAKIISGVFEGKSTGSPITILIPNEDARSKDYDYLSGSYRPSHADYTYDMKYGIRDHRGGGRASARETASRVAAGAIAKLLLHEHGIQVQAFVKQIGKISLDTPYTLLDLAETESNMVRCPDPAIAAQMSSLVEDTRKKGDTLGGVIQCVIRHCPPGLGSPVFDKLHAALAGAMMSINAAHGFEYGSGFEGASRYGSGNNDTMYMEDGQVKFGSNHSGGILGGISNGDDIYFNVAFKPVATIMKPQASVNRAGEDIILENQGRHDACVVPRAVPIVEAMAALVMADHLLLHRASRLI